MTALVLAKNNYCVYHAFTQILPVYVECVVVSVHIMLG